MGEGGGDLFYLFFHAAVELCLNGKNKELFTGLELLKPWFVLTAGGPLAAAETIPC